MIDLLQIRSHDVGVHVPLARDEEMRDRIRIGVVESRRWDPSAALIRRQRITNLRVIVAAIGVCRACHLASRLAS